MVKKTVVSVFLLVLGVSAVWAGASKQDSAKGGTVTLKALFVGSPPNDEANVLAAVNKKLASDGLNIQIRTVYVDDYWNKLALAIAGGEEYDLVWAHASTISDLVAKGVYQPLDKVLTGSNIISSIPKSTLAAGTVNKELYALARVIPMAEYNLVYNIRGDLRKKYGIPEITTLAGLEAYFDAILANEPNMICTADHNAQPLYPVFANYYFPIGDGGMNPLYVDPADPSNTVKSFMESDGFKQTADTKYRWRQKGYIPPDNSRAPNPHLGFINGIVACIPSNTLSETERVDALVANIPGAVIETVLLNPNPLYLTIGGDNMLAVASTSKHPGETVAFINWIKSNQTNFDLWSFGIEGVNYKLEGRSISYAGIPDNKRYSPNVWMWNDISLARFSKNVPASNIEKLRAWDKNAKVTPYVGFNLNQASIKTEISQINAVITEYYNQLKDGSVSYDSVKAGYAQALRNAGLQRVIDECQKQLNAYIAK
ncbi:MAG: ABC transporter substrate-binding protein [Spirochaetaceae bacterium]|jgi:putative aldouronate transport system substrate-binding protein|nr:ABC transporter substrate-binding protein [Spirochaetaceae bacterium]